MLFEEFVEQHRVDLVVADGVGFSVFVHPYQGGIHLCYFFSNQAKLGRVGRVVLVVEGHWFERVDLFAGLAHRVNVLLEPLRGDADTKLAGGRVNRYVASERAITEDTGDIAGRDKGRRDRIEANADRSAFDADAHTSGLVRASAPAPTPVLKLPLPTINSEYQPSPVSPMPPVTLKRALHPSAVLNAG